MGSKKKKKTSHSGGHLCSNYWTIWKESNDATRRRIEEDLKSSAAKYADLAEYTISKLQQANLKKYPQQYHAADAKADAVPNKTFGNKVSSLFRRSQPQEPVKFEDGTANISHGFQHSSLIGLLISVRR
jgi:hypothetical protein